MKRTGLDYFIIGWLLFLQIGAVLLIADLMAMCLCLAYFYFGATGVVVLVASFSALMAIVAHFAKEE